jgi:3-oxoacyl-[acyl-carrier protein] reductase
VIRERPVTRIVNCVGVVKPATLEKTTVADFDTVMALNVRCAVQCVQALVPGMRAARFGRIVRISSRAALGKELRTACSASKAALHGVTKTWALELAADGITANAVAPGTIETTAFFENNPRDDPRTQAIIDSIPAKRIGPPVDVAHAVSFFLDERSSFVNGQVLYVCGGLTVGKAT